MRNLILYLITLLTSDTGCFTNPVELLSLPIQESSVCHEQLQIHDSGGNHIKTVCYVNFAATYERAASVCRENNMKLYKFDSLDSYGGWLRLANSIWAPKSRAAVWVNGRRLRMCSGRFRIVESARKSRIYGDISYSDQQVCGMCMAMHNSYGQFAASPENCHEQMHFFCER